uniref:RING-type domain-containing protein n=1 Tax=Mycena chlorophos TaxID=658473 RepID=A0ABQ0KUI4_MYCCL|nr:predicted protein [Mycena chlorophos]
MSCSICLSKLKDPVSIPCGHVHCSDCLATHCATSSENFKAACPTCREEFNTVRPELACLPRKLHQYILPSIRRVYIDAPSGSSNASLRQRLAAAEAHARALDEDNDRLRAEAEESRDVASRRERLLVDEIEHATIEMADTEAELKALRVKYDKLKKHCRALEKDGQENNRRVSAPPPFNVSKRTIDVDLSPTKDGSTPKRLRIIRPLPSRVASLQTPTKTGAALGSPFRTG